MKFRKATLEDTKNIVELINIAYRGEQGWTTENDLVSGDRTTANEVLKYISTPDSYLFVLANTSVKSVICVQKRNKSAYIGFFAVHPELQNKGIGKEVLKQAENFAIKSLGINKFVMSVLSNRVELIDFYCRRGYVCTDEIADYPLDLNVGVPKKELKIISLVKDFLKETNIVDISNKQVFSLAKKLASSCKSDKEIAKACFLYVRDEIRHSGDFKDDVVTLKASEVLKHKTGWCYSKAILLTALLRANNIPTAFCYQRLSCNEYHDGVYCLHGLNAIYLKEYGWYRVDARGNKKGVDAKFTPPIERLAFVPQENEYDIEKLYADPLPEVIKALEENISYLEMVDNFPDIKS